jgi:hypothetical protein
MLRNSSLGGRTRRFSFAAKQVSVVQDSAQIALDQCRHYRRSAGRSQRQVIAYIGMALMLPMTLPLNTSP